MPSSRRPIARSEGIAGADERALAFLFHEKTPAALVERSPGHEFGDEGGIGRRQVVPWGREAQGVHARASKLRQTANWRGVRGTFLGASGSTCDADWVVAGNRFPGFRLGRGGAEIRACVGSRAGVCSTVLGVAQVVELVDTQVSEACAARCKGSSPFLGTILLLIGNWILSGSGSGGFPERKSTPIF